MIHLIGTKTRTACGRDTLDNHSDRITVHWPKCTCSACQYNQADYETALLALAGLADEPSGKDGEL